MRKQSSTNSENRNSITSNCPLTSALYLISGRWKLIILWNLRERKHRFSHLQRAIPLVTKKMLTQQLKELERDGMIHRKVYAVVPPMVEYSLTPLAVSLIPVLQELFEWGKKKKIGNYVASMQHADLRAV